MTERECQELAQHWDIDSVQSVDIPETGTINTIRILTTGNGRFVLRVYRHQSRDRIETEHRVVKWVAEKGIPAVVPIKTRDGEDYVEHKGQFVTVLPFASGKQIPRDQLQAVDVEITGHFLGHLHNVLEGFSCENIAPVWVKIEPTGTLAGIDRLVDVVRAIENPQPTDVYALKRLTSRREWLQGRALDDVSGIFELPFQVVHGDYQETNLFFEKGQISGVIDWDKIYTAPAAWEVVRALHLMLHFDLDHSITFLKAYQETNSLSLDVLDVVVHCYGLHRAYELWLYEEIYDQGNDRLRRFVYPGEFVPIADDWARLRPKVLEII